MTHGHSQQPTSRLAGTGRHTHIVHVATPQRGILELILAILGAIIVFALAAAVAFAAADRVLMGVGTSGRLGLAIAVCLAAAVGLAATAVWFSFLDARRYDAIRRRRPVRIRRLQAVLAHPDGESRLPCRLVEHMLYRPLRRRLVRRRLTALGAGRILVNAGPHRELTTPPPVGELRFEPIDLQSNNEQWLELMGLDEDGVPQDPPTSDGTGREEDQPPESRLRALWCAVVPWLSPALFVVVVTFGLYRTFATGRVDKGLYIYGLLGLLSLLPLFAGARWWLVPGGLIYRRHRVWRRRVAVSLITPADTPLLLDVARGMYLLHRGRLRHVPVSELALWSTLNAWLTTTPPPTRDAVLSFVGPDAVWEPND